MRLVRVDTVVPVLDGSSLVDGLQGELTLQSYEGQPFVLFCRKSDATDYLIPMANVKWMKLAPPDVATLPTCEYLEADSPKTISDAVLGTIQPLKRGRGRPPKAKLGV
jgi:hypothetical protein